MTGKAFSLNMPNTVRLSQRCNGGKALRSPQCRLRWVDEAVNETGLRGGGGEKPASHPLILTLDESAALVLPKRLWQSLGRGDGWEHSIPSAAGDVCGVHGHGPKLRTALFSREQAAEMQLPATPSLGITQTHCVCPSKPPASELHTNRATRWT